MGKKHWLVILGVVGVVLVGLLLTGALGVATALAQETEPTTDVPPSSSDLAAGPDRGRPGPGGFGFFGRGGDWRSTFDAAAEALGMTPVELFTALHDGQTLSEVAEAQGVAIEDVQAAIQAARAESMRQRIEQAVEEGTMSQDQADWLLEGLEQGFFPLRGRGRGWHGNRLPTDGD